MIARILLVAAAASCVPLSAAQTAPPAAAPGAPPADAARGKPPGDDASAQPALGDDRDTIDAGKKWLALLDSGKVGAAWDLSSAHLKAVVTRQKWVSEIDKVRKPYGRLATRTEVKFARTHSMPDAPDGDYSIVEYNSVYANGKRATEQVYWMLEPGDVWRVSGYFIR